MPAALLDPAQKYLRLKCGLATAPRPARPPNAQVEAQSGRINTQTNDPGECCEHSRGTADLVESTWASVGQISP